MFPKFEYKDFLSASLEDGITHGNKGVHVNSVCNEPP